MLENIAYAGLGFATVFLALEAAWHFTACKINKALFIQANWHIKIERQRNGMESDT
ncbi:MAG: hypothetical protein ACJ71K_11125 [Nitrososphaeraceae archaeon]